MKIYNFSVKKREVLGKGVKKLRENKLVPGVVYGSELKDSISVEMDAVKMQKLYDQAGESSLINLTIGEDKEPLEVLIKEVTYDPVLMTITHVDFYKIKRGQKIDATVELEFFGVSPAVKDLGGILIESLDEVEIHCLPKDLISEIKVDLSALKTFDDNIYVRDLNVPENVEIKNSPDDLVVTVNEPREEVIEEKAPETELPEDEKEEAEEGKPGGEESADEEEKKAE